MRALILSLVAIFILTACTSEEKKAQRAMMMEVTAAGDKVATVAFNSLSGHLKSAISTKGVEHAIEYCNINALPLTDSLSRAFGVRIRRTSDFLRNPSNKPDSLEAYMIDLYESILKMQKPMVGKTLLSKTNEVRYFAPIMVKAQCLQCHGTVGKEVTEETYAAIQSRYPGDAAVGYKEGQLRGIWSIDFGPYEQVKEQLQKIHRDSLAAD